MTTIHAIAHQLTEYGYIVEFLAGIIVVLVVAHVVAWATGYREK